nr:MULTISPECIES: hypothetical protein [unclassified Bradyrhizobium]
MRDGKSYSTRSVTATQHGKATSPSWCHFMQASRAPSITKNSIPYVPPPERLIAEELSKRPMFPNIPGIHPPQL